MFRSLSSRSRGQFLVGAIAFLAFLLIVIQAMVFFGKTETAWTKKEKQSTTAFYLAETGVNRAIWRLKETDTAFSDIFTSGVPAGYDNDVTYDDVPGGTYRVKMSTTGASEITIIGTGKDASHNEFRTVMVVLSQSSATTVANGAVIAPAINLNVGLRIFWGPVYSTGNLTLGDANNQLYVRKYSRGNIIVGGGTAYTRDSNGSTPPNTDGLEWWTYQDSTVVPDMPTVDLATYLAAATAQGRHYSSGTTSLNNQQITSTSTVFYVDGTATLKFTSGGGANPGTFVVGAIIVDGSSAQVWFDGTGRADPSYSAYSVTPPTDAWMEYQKNTPQAPLTSGCGFSGGGGAGAADDGNYTNSAAAEADKACNHQYPGDAGLHTYESYNFSTGCTHGNNGGATIASTNGIVFKGFIYWNGKLQATANRSVHGKIVGGSNAGWTTNGNLQLFYDPDTTYLTTSGGGGSGFIQQSWREIIATPF